MVARPIHRFGASDRLFHGADTATPADLHPGMSVLLGVAGEAVRALRDASWTLPLPGRLVDLGDVACDAVGAAAAWVLARGARPILCAGSAIEARALLGAARERHELGTVLISARLDACGPAGPGLAIGAHDLLPVRDVATWTGAGGIIVTADEVETAGGAPLTEALARLGLRRGVVLLDIGVVDTGHAAGTETVNVGGLTPVGFAAVLAALRAGMEVAALAICGLAPARDPRGHSERLAAQAVAALA